MAKPLGAKSLLIREAIKAHPDLSNKPLADQINGSEARREDKIHVTHLDVSQQRQALKKLEENEEKPAKPIKRAAKEPPAPKPKPEPVREMVEPVASVKVAQAAQTVSYAEFLARVMELSKECGGLGELKRFVDGLAEMRGQA